MSTFQSGVCTTCLKLQLGTLLLSSTVGTLRVSARRLYGSKGNHLHKTSTQAVSAKQLTGIVFGTTAHQPSFAMVTGDAWSVTSLASFKTRNDEEIDVLWSADLPTYRDENPVSLHDAAPVALKACLLTEDTDCSVPLFSRFFKGLVGCHCRLLRGCHSCIM